MYLLGITEIPEVLPTLLQKLERLDLSCNSLNDQSFPASFRSLVSLIELNLNSNLLTMLPPVIQGLQKLQRLYLGMRINTVTWVFVFDLVKLRLSIVDRGQIMPRS